MRIVNAILLAIAVLCIPSAWHVAKGAEPRLFSKRLIESRCINDVVPPHAAQILMQPFYYWAKGSQFYVYLSQDQRYVLKIPRASKLRESLIDRMLQRKSRKPDLLASLQMASEKLSEETGLILGHYKKTASISSVLLFDRLHRAAVVNVNNVPFALQNRHKLLSDALLEAQNSDEIKSILQSYLDFILLEKSKGCQSHDCAFWLNFGFDGGQVSRLDVGSYIPVDECFSLRRSCKPVERWLKLKNPSLSEWFDSEIKWREML